MSNELLEKVISTTSIGTPPSGGGLLTPEQSDRFIEYTFDATTVGAQVRTIRMRANEIELDRIAVGERLVRLATEAVDDSVNAGVAFTKVSLTTKKLRLDWELSSESLEDNLEGEALEDHIARLMSGVVANDLEDLAINGDVTNTDDSLLKSFDGWRKRLYAGGNVIDAAGVVLDRGVFNKALRAMPRNFMQRRGNLKFFTAAGLLQDYLFSAQLIDNGGFIQPEAASTAGLGTSNVAEGGAGWSPVAPFGIRAQEVPLFPEYTVVPADNAVGDDRGSDVWLTDAKNLIWGIKREIVVYRVFVPKKDSIEHTLFTRVGASIENPNASVLVKNVAYRD